MHEGLLLGIQFTRLAAGALGKLERLTMIPRFIIIVLKPTPGVRQEARL